MILKTDRQVGKVGRVYFCELLVAAAGEDYHSGCTLNSKLVKALNSESCHMVFNF